MSNQIDWIGQLKAIGFDTDHGLEKCRNDEGFYLKMLEKLLRYTSIDDLVNAYTNGNVQETIELALSIRGPMENLGVMKVYDPVQEIAFKLRAGGTMSDVKGAVSRAKREYEKLAAVLNNIENQGV